MSVELEHAEQVMLEHEKHNFADKPTKHDKKDKDAAAGHEKYSSLYSSFDELKQHPDWLSGSIQVYASSPISITRLITM